MFISLLSEQYIFCYTQVHDMYRPICLFAYNIYNIWILLYIFEGHYLRIQLLYVKCLLSANGTKRIGCTGSIYINYSGRLNKKCYILKCMLFTYCIGDNISHLLGRSAGWFTMFAIVFSFYATKMPATFFSLTTLQIPY